MTFERLWSLLESIQAQIRAFDTKAQVAIGVNGVLIGFATSEVAKAAEYSASGMFYGFLFTCISAGASLCASLTAIGFSIYVIHPQIELKQPRSHFFFCHIVEKYGRDFGKAARAIKELSEEEELDEIGSQVVSNSIVCDVKGKRCKPAIVLTGCALALYALSVIPYSNMAFGHSTIAAREQPRMTSAAPLPTAPTVPEVPKPAFPIWPYAVPIATICGAIAGTLITSFVSRRNAKEENALASRSKLADFREAWLNRLRDTIAELGAEVLSGSNDSNHLNRRRIHELAIKIKLLMNRRDPRYRSLHELLIAVPTANAKDESNAVISDLTRIGQDILKTEWEILKYDLNYEPPKVKKSRESKLRDEYSDNTQ